MITARAWGGRAFVIPKFHSNAADESVYDVMRSRVHDVVRQDS